MVNGNSRRCTPSICIHNLGMKRPVVAQSFGAGFDFEVTLPTKKCDDRDVRESEESDSSEDGDEEGQWELGNR